MYCMCINFEEAFYIYLQDLTQQHIPSRLLEKVYTLQCIVECSIPPQREYEYEESLVLFSLTNVDHLLVHFDM